MTDPEEHVHAPGGPARTGVAGPTHIPAVDTLGTLPRERTLAASSIVYRFPERALPGMPSPLAVDAGRRERPSADLGDAARRTLRALGEAIAPSRELGFLPGDQAIAFVEAFVPYMPKPLALAFPLGLRAIEWAPLAMGRRRVRFSELTIDERRSVLVRLRALPALGDAIEAVRGLVACAIYDHPAMHQDLGYAPQGFLDEKRAERVEKHGAPEPW